MEVAMQLLLKSFKLTILSVFVFGQLGCEPRVIEEIIYENPQPNQQTEGDLAQPKSSGFLGSVSVEVRDQKLKITPTIEGQQTNIEALDFEISTSCLNGDPKNYSKSIVQKGQSELFLLNLISLDAHLVSLKANSEFLECQINLAVKNKEALINSFHFPNVHVQFNQNDSQLKLQSIYDENLNTTPTEIKEADFSSYLVQSEASITENADLTLLCEYFKSENVFEMNQKFYLDQLAQAKRIQMIEIQKIDPRKQYTNQKCKLVLQNKKTNDILSVSKNFELQFKALEINSKLEGAKDTVVPHNQSNLRIANWLFQNPYNFRIKLILRLNGSRSSEVFPVYIGSENQVDLYSSGGIKQLSIQGEEVKNISAEYSEVILEPNAQIELGVTTDSNTICPLHYDFNIPAGTTGPGVCTKQYMGSLVLMSQNLGFEYAIEPKIDQQMEIKKINYLNWKKIELAQNAKIQFFNDTQTAIFMGMIPVKYKDRLGRLMTYKSLSFNWNMVLGKNPLPFLHGGKSCSPTFTCHTF